MMALLSFCESFVRLDKQPISFAGRPYLPQIYDSAKANLVLRCGRQVEKTTLLANLIVYNAVQYPGIKMLLCCPRREQAEMFSRSRLRPIISGSPLIARCLLGANRRVRDIMNLTFENESELTIRSAFRNADAARGQSADILLLDEFQDMASGDLPVLMETLSHSPRKQVVITGTPKHVDNHLEAVFSQSSACEWMVPCGCGKDVRLDEQAIVASGLTCPNCQRQVNVLAGRWVPGNPESTWGSGYCVNQLMVPWLSFSEIIAKQSDYDPIRFKNECLGLPTVLGDHVLTREELESCCNRRPMSNKLADVPRGGLPYLIAGLDWGSGGAAATLLTIGYLSGRNKFIVVHFSRFQGSEDPNRVIDMVTKLCREFRVQVVGTDGSGNGVVHNWTLAEKLQGQARVVGITYSDSNHKIQTQGPLLKWTIDRTENIGFMFYWIRKRQMEFPRLEDVRSFVEEFLNVVAEHDPYSHSIRYTKPETKRDDAVHSANYALIVARTYACPPSPDFS